MSIKRSNVELNDDVIVGMAKLKNETEEQHKEKHYEFDQILQLQNKQLMELEREQKKQQEKLIIKQQKQTNNLKKMLNLNIPFKEKQHILNEQKNNLLKRAKYRQDILDDQPPVEMALKMVLYFQHQHHQDTYNLLLYQHNQLQHAKNRKEQAHLYLEHQQMFLKLFDVQQKVLLQTLVEQQEKAEFEISALRHLSLNDEKDEDERTVVNDKNEQNPKSQSSFEMPNNEINCISAKMTEENQSKTFELPQEEDFESLKQLIPPTPNQIPTPLFMRNRNHSCSRDSNHSYSISQDSNDSTASTKSSPLFSFTHPKSTEAINEKIKDSYLLKDVIKKPSIDNINDHKRKEKEFMERSSAYLECKNIKDIKIDAPDYPSYHKKINKKTKENIDDFFYRAYEKYRKSKFISRIREEMIRDGFGDDAFQTVFDDDDNEEIEDDLALVISKNPNTIPSDLYPPPPPLDLLAVTGNDSSLKHIKTMATDVDNINVSNISDINTTHTPIQPKKEITKNLFDIKMELEEKEKDAKETKMELEEKEKDTKETKMELEGKEITKETKMELEGKKITKETKMELEGKEITKETKMEIEEKEKDTKEIKIELEDKAKEIKMKNNNSEITESKQQKSNDISNIDVNVKDVEQTKSNFIFDSELNVKTLLNSDAHPDDLFALLDVEHNKMDIKMSGDKENEKIKENIMIKKEEEISSSKSRPRSSSTSNTKSKTKIKNKTKRSKSVSKESSPTVTVNENKLNKKEEIQESLKDKDIEEEKKVKKEAEKEVYTFGRGRPKDSYKKKKDRNKSKEKKEVEEEKRKERKEFDDAEGQITGSIVVDGETIKIKEFVVEENDPENSNSGIKRKHKRVVRRFYCAKEGCNKSFTTSGHVTRHIRTCHLALRPFHCKYPGCKSKFGRQDNLRQHYKVHYRKDPHIKFNYREVLTQKQIKQLNISPEIMDVNNDELYLNINDSEIESTASVIEDNESEKTMFENKDLDEKTEETEKSLNQSSTSNPKILDNTSKETDIDGNKTPTPSTVGNVHTKATNKLKMTSNTENSIVNSIVSTPNIKPSTVAMSSNLDDKQKILYKENMHTQTDKKIKQELKIKSTKKQQENNEKIIDNVINSKKPESMKLDIKKENVLNEVRDLKDKQEPIKEIKMKWNLVNNLGLNMDDSLDKTMHTDSVIIPTNYDIHFPSKLEQTPSNISIKSKHNKPMSLDSKTLKHSIMNTPTNVNQLMSSPFINTKELETTPILSSQLYSSPSMDPLNTLPLSKTRSSSKKTACDSITIPSNAEPLKPLTPLSSKDSITSNITSSNISPTSANTILTTNSGFSGIDNNSMLRTTPINRSNSLPNPHHTPIVAPPSSASNPTSAVYLDMVQVPSHVPSHGPSQGTTHTHPSLPPSISTSNTNNILLSHPNQAGSPISIYDPNVLYNTMTNGIPNMYSIPSNISVPSNSLGYPSTLGNVSSNVYLTNANATLGTATPESNFQNTNPWLLEFQPMTTPASQNYPNYHMNSIENSDMEAINNYPNATNTPTSTTQNINQPFYYM